MKYEKQKGDIGMEKETRGKVTSVAKLWWFKVNQKPFRTHALDGAIFPSIITVQYTVDSKTYLKRKWISAGLLVPDLGSTVKVIYSEKNPKKAKIS